MIGDLEYREDADTYRGWVDAGRVGDCPALNDVDLVSYFETEIGAGSSLTNRGTDDLATCRNVEIDRVQRRLMTKHAGGVGRYAGETWHEDVRQRFNEHLVNVTLEQLKSARWNNEMADAWAIYNAIYRELKPCAGGTEEAEEEQEAGPALQSGWAAALKQRDLCGDDNDGEEDED
jgi:hypothetical protein